MPYPTFTSHDRVSAALLNKGKLEFVTNPAGAQSTTSTTFVDATNLSFPVEASARYWAMAEISYDAPASDTNGEVNFQWLQPSGAAVGRNVMAPALSATTALDTNAILRRAAAGTDIRAGGTTSTPTAFTLYQEVLDIVTSTTAGTMQLQVALGVGTGTATLQVDSIIYYRRIA